MPIPVSEIVNVSQVARAHRSLRDVERHLALLRELAGVGEQVEERLTHLGRVRAHSFHFACNANLEPVRVLLGERRDHRGDALDEVLDAEVLEHHIHLAGLDLRKVEHRIDQLQQVPSRPGDLAKLGEERLLRSTGLLAQHLAVPDDRVERSPQLVRHVGEELGLVRLAISSCGSSPEAR
jgi:hypothetical protein